MKQYTKTFIKFSVPAIMSMIVSTLYTIVDGIFVSRYVGPEALASVNIVWPFINGVLAIAMMIAIGGGALISIHLGENNVKRANEIYSQSVIFGVIMMLAVSAVAIVFARPLSYALGADDTVVNGCMEYLRFYLLFGVPFGMAPIFSAYLRNDRAPVIAFVSMVSGAATNIVLDYVFIYIFQWGLMGAAVASGIGQTISCVVAIWYLARQKGQLRFSRIKLKMNDIKKVVKTGSPEFIVEMCVPISMIAYNIVIMQRLGYVWVASYGIIMYIMTFFICIFAGLSHGTQPIISRYYGMQDFGTIKKVFRLGLTSGIVIAVGAYLLLYVFGREVLGIFTEDPEMIEMTYGTMKIFALNVVFAVVNIMCITYFQAQAMTKTANIISYNRGLTFNLLFIIVLPYVMGNSGIWIALTCTEAAAFVLSMVCLARQRRQEKKAGYAGLGA